MLRSVKQIALSSLLSSILYYNKRSFVSGFAMHIERSDGLGGKGITLLPKSGSYSKVLFWFHGLGDTADGWASAVHSFKLEDTKIICPTAESIPISLNGGMLMPGWFDIEGLSMEDDEDRNGFTVTAKRINSLIENELTKNGIIPSKIVLGGFSQGGAIALHVALRSEHLFAGCVALSTWLALRADYPTAQTEPAKKLPIFQVHGTADQVVSYEWGEKSHHILKTLVTDPAPLFKAIPRMGHQSCDEELADVKKFIESRLK